jgi:hypothetical protein
MATRQRADHNPVSRIPEGESMTERLTYSEIKDRYAPDWVLIDDPETDEHLEILSGKVLIHSPDRDELGRKMLDLWPRPSHSAVMFLGEVPDDLVLVL